MRLYLTVQVAIAVVNVSCILCLPLFQLHPWYHLHCIHLLFSKMSSVHTLLHFALRFIFSSIFFQAIFYWMYDSQLSGKYRGCISKNLLLNFILQIVESFLPSCGDWQVLTVPLTCSIDKYVQLLLFILEGVWVGTTRDLIERSLPFGVKILTELTFNHYNNQYNVSLMWKYYKLEVSTLSLPINKMFQDDFIITRRISPKIQIGFIFASRELPSCSFVMTILLLLQGQYSRYGCDKYNLLCESRYCLQS